MPPPNGPRDPIAGPDTVEPPFPLQLRGPVIKGFGRGSRELGIPTANIPIEGLSIGGHSDIASGVYYGWCTLDLSTATSTPSTDTPTISNTSTTTPSQSSNHAVADLESTNPATPNTTSSRSLTVYPTVLSIGYNPFYANTHRSIEIHILQQFDKDFYGAKLSLIILGFIRPEYDYVSKEALVEDIREDIRVARRSLEREGYEKWRGDAWLFEKEENKEEEKAEEVETHEVKRKQFGRGQVDGVAKCEMMP